MLSVKCPNCEKENELSGLPQSGALIRCAHCGQEFSAHVSQTAADETASQDIAKDLAQAYFSDIPEGAFAKHSAQESGGQAKASGASGKLWNSEGEVISDDERQQQRQRLLQYAQESAAEAEKRKKEELGKRFVNPQFISQKKFIREKKAQPVAYWILLLLICLLPAVRITAGRLTASVEQFSWMQPQIIPSFLYFFAAVFLLYHLLRRTTAPRWIAAVLLLVPLAVDGWYLVPDLTNLLSPGVWLNISNALKVIVSLFALIMSRKAKKHPARTYRRVEDH